MTDDEIFERLVRIDPVRGDVEVDPVTSGRATDLKGTIMNSDPNPVSTDVSPRPRRRGLVAGLIALGAAAAVIAVVALPGSDDAEPIVLSANQAGRSAMSSAEGGAATADAALPNNKMSMAPYTVEYVVEGEFPALDGKAQSWKATGKPSEERMTAVARALGIDAELVERKKEDGGGFVAGATDGSAPSVSFANPDSDPMLGWYFSQAWATPASTATDSVERPDEVKKPENLPSKDEARAKARGILDAADVEIRDEDIEVFADDWSVSVTAWQRVGDMRVPMSWTFGFGEGGEITWAGGNLMKFEKGPKFPRVGTAVGVERLSDPKYTGWMYGYGAAVSRDAAEPAIAVEGSDAAPTDTVAPKVETVKLTAVKESLTSIIDANNVVWLVPSYEYTAGDGYTLSVLAITDEFIEQAAPAADTVVDGGEVIEPAPAGDSGSSAGSPGSGETLPTIDVPLVSQEDAVTLVGLGEEEATKVAEANGWIVRVSSRDGEEFMLTKDYVTNRVNLAIVDGKVTGVSVG